MSEEGWPWTRQAGQLQEVRPSTGTRMDGSAQEVAGKARKQIGSHNQRKGGAPDDALGTGAMKTPNVVSHTTAKR